MAQGAARMDRRSNKKKNVAWLTATQNASPPRQTGGQALRQKVSENSRGVGRRRKLLQRFVRVHQRIRRRRQLR